MTILFTDRLESVGVQCLASHLCVVQGLKPRSDARTTLEGFFNILTGKEPLNQPGAPVAPPMSTVPCL